MLILASLVPIFSGNWENGMRNTEEVVTVSPIEKETNGPNPETLILPYGDDPNYQFAATKTPLKSFFSEKLAPGSGIMFTTQTSNGEEVSIVYEPTTMSLRYSDGITASHTEAEESAGLFQLNTAMYKELYPDVDFEFIVQAGKVKHNILLNKPPAVPTGAYEEGMSLDFDGVLRFPDEIRVFVNGIEMTGDFKTQEAIELRDENDIPLFTLPSPLTNDNGRPAHGIRSRYTVTFTDDGMKISVGTSLDWLLSAVYPVVVDPTVMGAEFIIDAKVDRTHRIVDATWHAGTGQFLVVWSEHPEPAGSDEIRGQVVNLDNSLDGGDFLISAGGGLKDFPQVAHIGHTVKPEQQMSLVVWMDTRDGLWDIWAQLVGPVGNTLNGANFKLSGADEDLFPEMAYGQIDGYNGRFLVAWERETAAGESEVYGQIVRGAASSLAGNPGDLIGGNFHISDTMGGRSSSPSVAFDPVNDQFLVVWADDRGGPVDEREIWGQFLDTDGNDVGGNFVISALAGLEYSPSVEYHPQAQEFLVVWKRKVVYPGQSDVHARRLSPAGALLGGLINVAVTGDQEESRDFAIDMDTGRYVIPINSGPTVADRVRVEMQILRPDGSLVGGRQQVGTDVVANKGPIVAVYGSTPIGPGAGTAAVSEVLFAWRDNRTGFMDVYGRMVEVLQDTDGDGLMDDWETNGYVDLNDNGVLDAGDFDFSTLPAANQPDVNHKDIYVEVDWMQEDADGDGVVIGDPDSPGDHVHPIIQAPPGSVPTGTSWDNVIAAFANAPVANPDGAGGINLHVDVGQMGGGTAIPETVGVDFYAAASFESVKQANFDPTRKLIFRYAIVKHEGSGKAEIWGNDFWLGDSYNTVVMQGTGFMHEMGHTLGLRHGGGDNTNCKPNYFSIMSYTHQLAGVPPAFTFNYSSQNLPALDESNLNEAVTLGGGGDQTVFSFGAADIGPNANTADNVPIDWDQDGTLGEAGAAVGNNNINNIDEYPGASPANEILNGFNIQFPLVPELR
jgi:hypothetical protein